MAEQAAAVGLTFNFDDTVTTNTFDAHRVVHFAAQHGKDKAVSERLFKAHFTDGENIGNRERLAALAAEAGLDAAAVAEMLETNQFADAVRGEEEEGSQIGIRGVPFYVVDRKYAVSGAQSPEVFLDTLNKAWSEKHPDRYSSKRRGFGCALHGWLLRSGLDKVLINDRRGRLAHG